MKRTITVIKNVYITWSPVDSVINRLLEAKQELINEGCEPDSIMFDVDSLDAYGGSSVDTYLSGKRLENENEMMQREQEEKEMKDYRRKQYENLKKEFEK